MPSEDRLRYVAQRLTGICTSYHIEVGWGNGHGECLQVRRTDGKPIGSRVDIDPAKSVDSFLISRETLLLLMDDIVRGLDNQRNKDV